MRIHDELPFDIDDLDVPRDDSTFRKLVKKVSVGVIGLFMVFLVVSYFVPGSSIHNIIAGQLASNQLDEDYSVTLDDGKKIIIDKQVYAQLKKVYFEQRTVEFKACLIGEKSGSEYKVTSMFLPKIFLQTFSSVSSEACPPSTIMPLHSHPYKSCIPSQQDFRSHNSFKEINPEAISALMCEVDRFNFYGF